MSKNKPLKLIIDTNLWVSFVISRKLNLLDPLLFAGNARLLFSTELITEIQETITKPIGAMLLADLVGIITSILLAYFFLEIVFK